jgi:hypothetical protein
MKATTTVIIDKCQCTAQELSKMQAKKM